jgi:hypothetical protein
MARRRERYLCLGKRGLVGGGAGRRSVGAARTAVPDAIRDHWDRGLGRNWQEEEWQVRSVRGWTAAVGSAFRDWLVSTQGGHSARRYCANRWYVIQPEAPLVSLCEPGCRRWR